MTRFNPVMEILPVAQKSLWPLLEPLKSTGFVLYGGTAIALQIGHRESVDFDFFASNEITNEKVIKCCPWLAKATTLQQEPNTWTVQYETGHGPVKLSFFSGLGIGRIGTPMLTFDGVLNVASLDDLFALKLSVIQKRAEAKDYLDIAALLDQGADLDEGLAGARALYGTNFQPAETLKAMTYFGDGDLSNLPEPVRNQLTAAAVSKGALPPKARMSDQLTDEKI